MTGGLFELVARGIEDIFITSQPQITFFKTIYRRHTNFSRGEYDLIFKDHVDFGKQVRVKIERLGDLLHRIFLVLELPNINLVYSSLTVGQVVALLAEYGITWVPDKASSDIYDEQDNVEVFRLIELKKQGLVFDNAIINSALAFLNGSLYPATWMVNTGNPNSDVTNYIMDVLNSFMTLDQYNIEYQFVNAENTDNTPPVSLANAQVVLSIIFEKFLDYATGVTGGNFNTDSYTSENLYFYFQTDTANYNLSSSTNELDANTVFTTAIANAYNGVPYTNLDSYFIFKYALNQYNAVITSNSDVIRIKTEILQAIQYGLEENIQQLSNIYSSLNANQTSGAKFMFYRDFATKTGGFDLTASWYNLSLLSGLPAELQDNFTNVFTVQPTGSEPTSIPNPLENYVATEVNIFNSANKNMFNSGTYIDYFNALTSLWGRTDVGTAGLCLEQITGSVSGTPAAAYQRMYFLDYLPVLENNDIPIAIDRILAQLEIDDPNISKYRTNLVEDLNQVADEVHIILLPKICIQDDFNTIESMSSFKTLSGANGDIMLVAILRQEKWITLDNENLLLPMYVAQRHINVLNSFDGGSDYTTYVLPTLIAVVNLFVNTNIPTYTTYVTLGYNQNPLYRINSNTGEDILCDVTSAIYYDLLSGFVDQYNNLYNNEILSLSVYKNTIGAEMLKNITEIGQEYLGQSVTDPKAIDYYIASTMGNFQNAIRTNTGSLWQFLNNELTEFISQWAFFMSNYGLLNIRTLVIPNQQEYYDTFENIVDYIIDDNVEVDTSNTSPDPVFHLLYYHLYHHQGLKDPAIDVRDELLNPNNKNYDPTLPHNSILDILDMAHSDFEDLITQPTNPFDPATQLAKYNLWNMLWIPNKTFDDSAEDAKYTTLFGGLTTAFLYSQLTLFNVQYNGMIDESDTFAYMKNLIIAASFWSAVPSLEQDTVTDTYTALVNYYTNLENQNNALIAEINGILTTTLENALKGGQTANFAWVEKIGHYIIEKMWIQIGDQIIDTQYGEWLEINHQLTRRRQKERGYNILIGNVPELTTYVAKTKNSYKLYIPIKFWFCHDVGNSLPLVALQHSQVDLFFKFREFSDMTYYEDFTQFVQTPRLKGRLLAEYIFIEGDERERIVRAKNEYIMEQLQYNGDLELTKNSLTEDGIITTRFYFKNPIKEYVWVLQRQDFVDGSQENGNRKWDNYTLEFDNKLVPMMDMAEILFNSRQREVFKDATYYNYVVPDMRHTSSPYTGIYVYSFGLQPEKIQPTGQANLTFVDDAGINMTLTQDILDLMNSQNIRVRWGIYAKSYNFLRVMSGMAGLAFYF